jgi:phage gp46-like protein
VAGLFLEMASFTMAQEHCPRTSMGARIYKREEIGMSQNLLFDPVKKDYIFVNGSPTDSDRIEEAAYYALTIPQNNWTYSTPGQGSLLNTLENIKRDSSVEQKFASYSQDAIKRQLISSGKAIGVSVKNTLASQTATENNINIIPANVQLSNQLNFAPV